MIVYTSICMNYMPKALVLGESLKKHNPNVKFYIILLEREMPKEINEEMYKIADKIILAKELGYKDFDKFIFKHSIVEASTSVKGQALVHILETEADDKVLYMDPDIKVYKELTKLDSLLDEKDVILTPHVSIPEETEIDIQNNELCALQHGVYNLGFLAVRKSEEGLRFARWWRDRLHLYCYDDIPRGIFTDQRWVDLAPAMFDVYILKDTGHNMAPWNLSKRKLYEKDGKLIVNEKDELVFFHFSGFDSGANLTMFEGYIKDKNAPEFKIRDEYIADLNRREQESLGNYVWSYSNYKNGEKIDTNIRREYRDRKYFNIIQESPFDKDNEYFKQIFNLVPTENHKDNLIIRGLRKIKRIIVK